ncbi:6-carboxytetrahydropterin synthase QueD [Pseudanabaena sp. UWO310]|uniref:6-carboxytetrahydropterin synthase QueD n=1 Tax=Pseudanabaena sp. UWO310 TaxID=2480795 RepID=UPI00115731E2|nr:6-carboxytetrahydropterin synthase QueD [Pseudanabaena sp. UWO310]TYQ30511.1 6-carboxytetrahydropterin synthase QueD [Pseudanabaena sp. UWO310]
MWIISKEFRFDAAHKLPHHDGKCQRLHGHSFVGKVSIKSDSLKSEGSQVGMVLDYGIIKKYLEPMRDRYLDHHYLNESTGLENPTSEELARWIFNYLKQDGLEGLYSVEIQETCTSSCIYFGEDEA